MDILEKEISDSNGPKPVVLELGSSSDDLAEFLRKNYNLAVEGGELVFDSNFCIIVRDEEAKSTLPAIFNRAIVLTIVEVKGLEFNDVLIWDFFSQSASYKAWDFISKHCAVEETVVDQKSSKFQNYMKRKAVLLKEKVEDFEEVTRIYDGDPAKLKKSGDYVKIKKISVEGHKGEDGDFVKQEETSSELKLLYVAITRAKKRLIIYDSAVTAQQINKNKRLPLERLWRDIEAVIYLGSDKVKEMGEQMIESKSQLD